MTAQHTPEQWESEGRLIYALRPDPREGHSYRPANVFMAHIQNGNGFASEEELDANVRLMKAAPLMLSTLRMVEFSPDGYCPWCEGENFHLTDCQIEAAIRAATGEDA